MIKCVPLYYVLPSNYGNIIPCSILIGNLSSFKNRRHRLMVQDFVIFKIPVSCQCFELLLLLSPVAMELCRDGEITDIMEV